MTEASLQNVINVAAHGSLHACVKKLEFCPRVLPWFSSFANWSSAFSLTDGIYDDSSLGPIVKFWVRFKLFLHYLAYSGQQLTPHWFTNTLTGNFKAWVFFQKISADFIQAITKLTNLQALDIITEYCDLQDPCLIKWRHFQCTTPFSQEMADDIEEQTCYMLYAFGHRNRHTTPLTSMNLSNRDWAYWSPESLGTLWDRFGISSLNPTRPPSESHYSNQHSLIKNAFVYLTRLDLDLDFCTANQSHVAHCAAFLRGATKLTHLRLCVNSGQPPFFSDQWDNNGNWLGSSQGEISWNVLSHLRGAQWPKLRSLELTVSTSEASLVGLLKCVSPTLRHLGLIDCVLFGRWDNVILQLPKVFSLQSVDVENLLQYHSGIEALWQDEEMKADHALFQVVENYCDLTEETKRPSKRALAKIRNTLQLSEEEFTEFVQDLLEAFHEHIIAFILKHTDEEPLFCPWEFYIELCINGLAAGRVIGSQSFNPLLDCC